MEGLQTTRSPLRKGDYLMKLDLKDAYYAVRMHPESRKLLGTLRYTTVGCDDGYFVREVLG